MTRINTNVSSLVAQKTLSRTNADLQTSLTRLSTGLRINVGKDDPAGLIASEALRSDITAVEKAIGNSERANQLIATADSALGQVSQLLNDIRGLVSEAANSGALSDDQIAANQLQIDSSLEAIDRISQITTFQGRRILDGSLDFISNGVDNSAINDLQIDQANFGTQTSINVNISVTAQATRGELNYRFGAVAEATVLEVAGGSGSEAFSFAAGSTVEEIASAVNLVSDATGVEAVVEEESSAGSIVSSSFGANNDIVITANEAGFDPGDVRVKYVKGGPGAATSATFTEATGEDPAKLEVTLGTSSYEKAEFTFDDAGQSDDGLTIRAKVAGEGYNGVTVVLQDGVAGGAGNEVATYDDATRTLTIDIESGVTTAAQVETAIAANAETNELFEVEYLTNGTGGELVIADAGQQLAGGADGGEINATARDVVTAINAAQSQVTAALADDNHGFENVSEFSHFAFSGSEEANNRLQFLAPGDSPNVRFVANAGQSLGIDTTTDPRVEGFSKAVVQNSNADASFVIRATQQGSEYDDYTISVVHDAAVSAADDEEFAVLDHENKTLEIHIQEGAGNSTLADIIGAVNGDDFVNDFFSAEIFGDSDGSADITDVDDYDVVPKTAGGLTSAGTLIVNLETDENGVVKTTANDLIAFFDDPSQFISDSTEASLIANELSERGISISNVGDSDGAGALKATDEDLEFATSGTQLEEQQASGDTKAVNGENARVTFTSRKAGAEFDDVQVQFVNDGAIASSSDLYGDYDANSKTLTLYIQDGVTTAEDISKVFTAGTEAGGADADQYDADLAALFTAAAGGTGAGVVTTDDHASLVDGVVDTGNVDGAALFGNTDEADLELTFRATDYGSANFVQIKALSGDFELTNSDGEVAERDGGTDVDARINGVRVIGKGLKAAINTSSLDLSFALDTSVADGASFNFDITGGGALFQLGPDVVSNQQARLGIQSVSTATLGGVSGRLFELRSGGAKSLTNDVSGAANVADEVIASVSNLRGRLGAFQKTTLESNIFTLNDTLSNLKEAESTIRDADFAAESARLTRAQILVQSGTSVLSIANSNPQNVLALLRG